MVRWILLIASLLLVRLDASNYWQPHVSATGRLGSYRQGGSADIWLPFAQGTEFVAFGQAHGARLRHQWSAGAGGGFRTLLSPVCAAGLNGFADWSRSRYGVNRLQMGAGGEVFGPCWHARVNGYFPQVKSTPVILNSQNELEVIGNEVILDQIGTTGLDQAYTGLDAEVGCLPFSSGWVEVWGFAGTYGYWADGARPIYGPRLRLEYRMEDLWGWCQARLTAGGEWQYDRVRGHQTAFVVTFRLPLGYRSAGSRCCPIRSICRRMGDAVYRNPGATLQARVTGETLLRSEVLTNTFFIWETNIAGAGTQQDPTSLLDAVSRAGPGDYLIFLEDLGNIQVSALGANSIITQNRQQLRGYGDNGRIDLVFSQGQTLTITPLAGRTGARAVLDGVGGTDAIELAMVNRVDGLQLDGGLNQIRGTNVGLATINDMILQNAAIDGIFIDGTGTARVTNSSITGAGNTGIRLDGAVQPDLRNNTAVAGLSRGLYITSAVASPIQGTIQNNSFTGVNNDGVTLEQTGVGVYTLTFDNNRLASTSGAGGRFSNTGDCDLLTFSSFASNTVTGSATMSGGLLVERARFDQANGGMTEIGTTALRVNGDGLRLDQVRGSLTFTDLDIANDTGTGLFIRDCDGKTGNFAFGTSGGVIDTTSGSAMNIDPVTLACVFNSVSSASSPFEGILLDTVTGSLVIQDGDITGSTNDAFSIVGPASLQFTYSGTATNTSSRLIFVSALTGGSVTFDGASLTDTGADGITVQNAGCSVHIERATIDNPTQDAIQLTNNTGSFTFNSGEIQNAGFRGVNAANIGDFTFTDTTTQSNNSGVNNFILVNGFGSTLVFTGNTLNDTTTDQSIVSLAAADALTHTATINSNTIDNGGGTAQSNGISIIVDAPMSTVEINSNTITGTIDRSALLAILSGSDRTGAYEMTGNIVDITSSPGNSALQYTTALGTEGSQLVGTITDNTVTSANGDGINCCSLNSAATGSGVTAHVTVTDNKITPTTGTGIRIEFGQSGGVQTSDALIALVERNMCDSCQEAAVRLSLGTGPGQTGMISATIDDNSDTAGAAGMAVYDIGNTGVANSINVCGTLSGNSSSRPAMGIVLDQTGFETVRITDLSNIAAINNLMTVISSGTIMDLGTTTCPTP